MAFVHFPREPNAPGFEAVKCVVCSRQVLVDRRLPRGEVLTKRDIFVCPECLIRTDPLRFREKKQN
jgi:uncharacterized protein YlaI